jgi:hypothetical protein
MYASKDRVTPVKYDFHRVLATFAYVLLGAQDL